MSTLRPFLFKKYLILLCCLAWLISFSTATLAQKPQSSQQKEYAFFSTSKGDFTVELASENAPITVANFVKYAKSGAYDNTIFHRVIRKFMIQGGGYTKNLQHIPEGKPIINESRNRLSNTTGAIAMARGNDPHSATSEFFINVANNESLNYRPANPGYTVFGRVVQGLSVIFEISQQKTKREAPFNNLPVEPIILKKVTLSPTLLQEKSTKEDKNAKN